MCFYFQTDILMKHHWEIHIIPVDRSDVMIFSCVSSCVSVCLGSEIIEDVPQHFPPDVDVGYRSAGCSESFTENKKLLVAEKAQPTVWL